MAEDGRTSVGGVDSPSAVLVVDDDRSMRRLLAAALSLAGFRTVEAAHGAEALEILRHQSFDAMLLDNHMPEMSGLEVVVALRARPETRTLPIILVTGDDDVSDRVRGLQAGADDYVVKPFHPDELVARVRAQLRGQRAWSEAIERQMRERSAIAGALCRVNPDSSPEGTAELVCSELRTLRGLAGAALIVFLSDGFAVPLAVQDLSAWGMESGRPLPRALARYLETRAGEGPWLERETGAAAKAAGAMGGRVVACAPMRRAGEPLGLLALAAAPSTAVGDEPGAALAAAIDFATIAAELLAPSLLEQGERQQRRSRLEDILRTRAFSPVFQPIVELRGAQVIGFEALTRFDDGTRPDSRFAEASALDRGIELERATMMAALGAEPSLPRSAWLSLNVSPPLVLTPGVLEDTLRSVNRPLVLELTEHDRVEDYQSLRRAIDRLGDNVRLSVDDAGSGFASLRHVLALEPSFVKLDHSWVSGIHRDPARRALVAGLTHFAQQTGCILIAEGIETEPELEVLQELAVDLGQGFLFGRPAPVGADIS